MSRLKFLLQQTEIFTHFMSGKKTTSITNLK